MGQIQITKNIDGIQPTLSPDNYFVLSASTNTEDKFRYKFELYIFNEKVFSGTATPNPEGLGIIPIGDIIHNYTKNAPVAYESTETSGSTIFVHQTSYLSTPLQDEVVEWWCNFGEEHSKGANLPPVGFTGIGNTQGDPSFPSGAKKSFLGTMGRNIYSNLPKLDTDKFFMSGYDGIFPSEQGLFLTNSPRIRNISSDEYFTLSCFNYKLPSDEVGNYSYVYAVNYRFYDESESLLTGYTIDNIRSNGGGPRDDCNETYPLYTLPSGETSTQWNILHVAAGPRSIYIPDDTAFYRVQLQGYYVSGGTTPTPTPTPTTSLPSGYTSWEMVNCCNADDTILLGLETASGYTGFCIYYNNRCYYANQQSPGATNYVSGGADYANCEGCIADHSCPVTPTKGDDSTPTPTPTYTPTPPPVNPDRQTCNTWSYVSEIFQFNLIEVCDDYDTNQFMFKNRYGTWDYYSFTKKKTERVDISRERYSKFDIDYGSSNPIKETYSRGLTDYSTQIREIHTYNSGFINQSDMYYLEELYTSNDVYMILDTGIPFPINILNTSFEKKTRGREKEITNLTIQFEFANNIKLLNK